MVGLIRRLSSRFIRKPNLPDVVDRFTEDDFGVTSAYRHGYPDQPSCFAFDPVSRLLAIATKDGFITLYGRPGVEQRFQHDQSLAVTHIIFLPNTKQMLSVCGGDRSVYLWDLVNETGHVCPILQKKCSIQCHGKEKICHVHLPFNSEWAYLGTTNGNVYTINVKTLKHSNYVIYWSNANAKKTHVGHPGEVVGIVEPPSEPSRLLIAYSKGLMVIWNLAKKMTEKVFDNKTGIKTVYWHYEKDSSKRFTVGHIDGSLSEWEHDKRSRKTACLKSCIPYDDFGNCDYIGKVLKAKRKKDKNPILIFTGGLPATDYIDKNTVTIIQHRKPTDYTTLDCTSKVIDIQVIETPPYKKDETFAVALIILTEEELIVIDLVDEELPEFRLPYLSPIHSSPVTCVRYLPNCTNTFLELLKSTERAGNYSQNAWPITGGKLDIDGEPRMTDLVVTGHEDGAINIWLVSTSMMRLVYSRETEKLLEPTQTGIEDAFGGYDDEIEMRTVGKYNPFLNEPDLQIQMMELCPFSRTLCVSNKRGEVYKFVFNPAKRTIDTPICTVDLSPPNEPEKPTDLKTSAGAIEFPPGLQPELCIRVFPPRPILTMALNPSAGLLSFGNAFGLAIFDIQSHKEIHAVCTLDKTDPYYDQPFSNMTRGEKLRRTFSFRASRSSKRGSTNANSVRRAKSAKSMRSSTRSVKSPPVRAASANQRSSFGSKSSRKSRLGASRRGGLGQPGQEQQQETVDEGVPVYKKSRVVSLVFSETFPPDPNVKGGPINTLWAGLGNGRMHCYYLNVPQGRERQVTGVDMQPCGSMSIHHHDAILFMGFVDKQGKLLPEHNQIGFEETREQPHYLVCVSTVQVKVISLPGSLTVRKDKLNTNDYFKKAFIMTYKNAAALVCLKMSGDINIYSLPHLKQLARNARCMTNNDVQGIETLMMSKNGYAVYLYNSSELQWITVAEAFMPPDAWTIPDADPVYRKKIKFDKLKLFEKGKGTVPGAEQEDEAVKPETTVTETRIEFPKDMSTEDNSLRNTSPDYPGSPELFSPEGSMCDDNSDKQSDTGSRSGRRRSSIAEALADVKNVGYKLFKSASKNSISEKETEKQAALTDKLSDPHRHDASSASAATATTTSHDTTTTCIFSNTKQGFNDRGEQLKVIENNTEELASNSRDFFSAASKLRQQTAAKL